MRDKCQKVRLGLDAIKTWVRALFERVREVSDLANLT